MPEHVSALAWLTRLAEDPSLWGLPVFCPGEFVRVVTHPRIFDPPTRLESALEALFGLLASPSLRVLNPGPRYPELFSQHLREADARGNLADTQIAAVCVEYRVTALLTAARDFARFAKLKRLSLSDAATGSLRSPSSRSRSIRRVCGAYSGNLAVPSACPARHARVTSGTFGGLRRASRLRQIG
ncbi:MAG: hypothetical protein M3461_19980 [Pseudomonadota bacterium]|nr:hypothetical protein [Pseudomonadota bacterium]